MRLWVFLTGLSHFCQTASLLFGPKMLKWREEFSRLSPINWEIFRVLGLGVSLAVAGLGAVVMVAPGEMVSGDRLGIALSAFLSAWWGYRTWVQISLYRGIWPGGWLGRLSYHVVALLLFYLTSSYACFFFVGMSRYHP